MMFVDAVDLVGCGLLKLDAPGEKDFIVGL